MTISTKARTSLALALVLAACGGQTGGGKDPPRDQAVVWVDRSPAGPEASAALEGGAKDLSPAGTESALKPDTAVAPKPDQAAPSGLGAICTGTCAAPDELCVFRTSSTSKGVCLKKCSTPNTPCAAPDPKYFLPCLTYTSTLLPAPVNLCAIACEFQGKTYPCPNAVDYTCKVYGPMSVCVPK
jgi:hypothetical protein